MDNNNENISSKNNEKIFLDNFLFMFSRINDHNIWKKLKDNIILLILKLFKHPIVAAVIAGIILVLIFGDDSIKIEPSEACWKVEENELCFYYKETYNNLIFGKWYGCHMLAKCLSDPKELYRFLSENAPRNKNIKIYLKNLYSDKEVNAKRNAIAVFAAYYWMLVKKTRIRKINITKDHEVLTSIKIPLNKIKPEIFDKLEKKNLKFPKINVWIDWSKILTKYDTIVLGPDSSKFLEYIKIGINKEFHKYFSFQQSDIDKQIQYHILPKVTELKTETCIIPQLELYFYRSGKLHSTFRLPLPIVSSETSRNDIYIQNAFRGFIGTLLRKSSEFNN